MATDQQQVAQAAEATAESLVEPVLEAMIAQVRQVTGGMVLLAATTRATLEMLDREVGAEVRMMSDASYRLDHLSREVERAHAAHRKALAAQAGLDPAAMRADSSSQVQTLRATFLIAIVAMVLVVAAAEWIRARSEATALAPAAESAPASRAR
jgi:hypothetical protein